MSVFFKNLYVFSTLFFIALFVDIGVKLYAQTIPYRFISKSLIVIFLLVYYLLNNREILKRKFRFMIIALLFFLIGDMLLILFEIQLVYIAGICCFIFGKAFYVFRFSNQRDFKLMRLLPFLILCFLYMLGILTLSYDNLGVFFYPVLVYLFIAMIVVLFVLLRKGAVPHKSYYLVLLGVFFSVLSDSISVLQTFYLESLAYHTISIMLFYGLSQYFIVIEVVMETKGQTEALKI